MPALNKIVPKALRAARTTLESALTDSVLILNYHRINAIPSDASTLTVSSENFREQMRVVRETCEPVRLESLSDRKEAFKKRGRGGRRRVVVTFDDGYADNFTKALPVLEEFEIPATVFVTTGNIGSRREFWWDELEGLVIDEVAEANLEKTRARLGLKKRSESDTKRERASLYSELGPLLKFCDHEAIDIVLRTLREEAGGGTLNRDSHRSLTLSELRDFGHHPLIDIGAHTVSHLNLGILDRKRQKMELGIGKQYLEEKLGKPVRAVAYPFGEKGDYNAETFGVNEELGFATGVTTNPGVASPMSHRYALPRLYVKNWSGDQFRRQLKKNFWAP
jgi:peptidoglycan/xylan/chitin deacetylase (PgdA/CDA1 family)